MLKVKLNKELLGASGRFTLDVDFSLEQNKWLTIYGTSGAGKTTILRMLAGLIKPDSGFLSLGDTVWYDDKNKINLKPQERNIGVVFQDYALFPNLTVLGNLKYALNHNASTILDEVIDMFELQPLLERKPHLLSGGQQQRVALARTLMQQPKLLVLDEPLSALDAKMRWQLQEYLLKMHQSFDLTTILISHDVAEIIRLSDKILELEDGKVKAFKDASHFFSDNSVSGKFKFVGVLISIESQNFLNIASVLVGKELIKVVLDKEEAKGFEPGDEVMIASKAFNPIITKLD